MSQKSTVFFLGSYDCHFLHRQRTDKNFVVKYSDSHRVWFEYTKDNDPARRKSRLCVYRAVTLKTSFLEELRAAQRGEIEIEGVKYSPDMTKRRGQCFEFPSGLSPSCDDRVGQIETEIRDCAEKLIVNFRWRLGLSGPGKPLSGGDFLWSEDRENWATVPRKIFGHPEVQRDIIVENLREDVLQTALDSERVEPIAHCLFRDAWCQRWSDQKSALTQGVSALEVGVKHCIINLVPNGEYLILEMPSPPVVHLLRDYLPKLVSGSSVKAPPLDADTLRAVQKMVHQRNLLVHKGELTVDVAKTIEFLEIIHDILYYLDFLSGNKWALSLTSEEFKTWIEKELRDVDLVDPLALKPNASGDGRTD